MIEISEIKQKQIVKYLTTKISEIKSKNQDFYETKIPEFWSRYLGKWSSKVDKNFPWKNSADFHVPLTMWACKSTESRILNAVMSSEDICLVNPLVPIDMEKEEYIKVLQSAKRIQNYLKYLFTKVLNIEQNLKDWIQRIIVEGTGVFVINYEKIIKIIKKYEHNKKIGYLSSIVKVFEQGVEQIKKFLKIQSNEKVVHNGITIYNCPLNKFICDFKNTNIQESEFVAIELEPMSYRQIKLQSKHEGWINVEKLYKKESQTQNQEIEDKEDNNNINTNVDINQTFTLYKCWCYYDVDDDGNEENCEFIVDNENNVLVFYKENDNFWGERPITVTPFDYISGILNGQGMPDKLSLVNDELDTIHDQIIDNATRANAIVGTYIPNKLSNKVESLTLTMGTLIPVTDHSAIKLDILPSNTIDLKYLEQIVMSIAEKIAVITDTSMGRETNVERPTFRGKYLLLQEFAVNFDIFLRNINKGLTETIYMILKMLYQYMPKEGLEYSVLDNSGEYVKQNGRIVKEKLTREDLEYLDYFEIKTMASSINAIKGLQEQKAMTIYEMFAKDETGEIDTSELKRYVAEKVDPKLAKLIMTENVKNPKTMDEIIKIQEMLKTKEALLNMRQEKMGIPTGQPSGQPMPQQGMSADDLSQVPPEENPVQTATETDSLK